MSAVAQRVARHRLLKKEGGRVLNLRIDNLHLFSERLIDEGLIEWHEAEDLEAIERAAAHIIKLFYEENT